MNKISPIPPETIPADSDIMTHVWSRETSRRVQNTISPPESAMVDNFLQRNSPNMRISLAQFLSTYPVPIGKRLRLTTQSGAQYIIRGLPEEVVYVEASSNDRTAHIVGQSILLVINSNNMILTPRLQTSPVTHIEVLPDYVIDLPVMQVIHKNPPKFPNVIPTDRSQVSMIETSRGSTYQFLPDQTTVRTKIAQRSIDPDHGEKLPQDLLVFIKAAAHRVKALTANLHDASGLSDICIFDVRDGYRVRTNTEAIAREWYCVIASVRKPGTIDPDNTTTVFEGYSGISEKFAGVSELLSYSVTVHPALGLSTFDSRIEGDGKHIGNTVSAIRTHR